MAKKKTGTREWSESTVNIQLGCEHGCLYCYARNDAVTRHKWCTAEQWKNPVIVQSKVARSFLKRSGIVMYPSTHDVTLRNLSDSVRVLLKLLDAGNRVLLVSKPNIECITTICDSLRGYKKQLSFRFTIGSMNDRVLSFWEPNAPGFVERKQCLMYAFSCGYRTSVSCEPFLDCKVQKVIDLYEELEPYIDVIGGFWIGKLRHFDKRVDMDSITWEQDERFVKPLKAAQSDEFVLELYQRLQNERPVKWKDSIREVIDK